MTPNWRQPAGILLILAAIAIWAVLVTSLSDMVARWHWTLQLLFYLVTGIVWIMPMKPLLRWMERV